MLEAALRPCVRTSGHGASLPRTSFENPSAMGETAGADLRGWQPGGVLPPQTTAAAGQTCRLGTDPGLVVTGISRAVRA